MPSPAGHQPFAVLWYQSIDVPRGSRGHLARAAVTFLLQWLLAWACCVMLSPRSTLWDTIRHRNPLPTVSTAAPLLPHRAGLGTPAL